VLLTRILTAVIGIPLIFLCIYFGGLPFYLMVFIISVLSVYEYLFIVKKYNPHTVVSLIMASGFFLFLCFCKIYCCCGCDCVDKASISAILMLLILFAIEVFKGKAGRSVERIATSFLGAFFIPLALVYMVYIRDLDDGMQLIFFIFIEVWVLDTAAYVFGNMFGKHKLVKEVSPKKTIEGAVAGIVFGVLSAVICGYLFMSNILTLCQSGVLGFVISIIGQFSDLAESLIKRDGNVKDSSNLIPGHGGVFDRFDSYIFAVPAIYYVLIFIK
jgi:phosphatidate cytidylyltransferase